MQVSVESTSELQRKITVQLPEEIIKEKMEMRLRELAKSVKIDGFRPGKVPHRVIRNRFGQKVREEVVGDLVKSSYYDAISEENLNPVGGPSIVPEESDEGEGFKYSASFEVFPEIKLANLADLEIKRSVSEVSVSDVDSMIENLREQRKNWKNVERPSRLEDRVTINFSGKAGEEELTDGEIKDHPLVLGSNAMIPGFEDELAGAEIGQKLNFELEFPSDYHAEKLAGKKGNFCVEVVKIEESEIPELDEEFVKGFGIEDGDLKVFHDDIKGNMERELNNTVRSQLKDSVMDTLLAAHEIDLPNALINQETESLLASYQKSMSEQNQKFDTIELRERANKQAIRRVKLGLIVNELTKQANLEVDKERVRTTIGSLAQSYQEPEEVINWYNKNPEQLRQIEQMVLEDQVVDWVVDRAVVIDEAVSFSELKNVAQTVAKPE